MPLNLEQHRGASTVWDAARHWPRIDPERWIATGAAGACLVQGLRRRAGAGWLLVLAGGALAWWAATTSEQRRTVRRQIRTGWPFRKVDVIGEASEESFPASDAPSWTPVTGSNRRDETQPATPTVWH